MGDGIEIEREPFWYQIIYHGYFFILLSCARVLVEDHIAGVHDAIQIQSQISPFSILQCKGEIRSNGSKKW